MIRSVDFFRTLVAAASIILIGGTVTACGQVSVFGRTVGESNHASGTPATPSAKAAIKVKTVSVVVASDIAEEISSDAKFDVEALVAAIKSELQSRDAFDFNLQAGSAAEIVIDDYALTPVSNAIVFGQIISAGVLKGSLRLVDAGGKQSEHRRIEAKSQVSIAAKGETKNPLGPLYGRFSTLVGNEITGEVKKSPDADNWRPR